MLTRFEDYWGDEPQVGQATYVWRSEPTVAAQMVEVGEADITMSIPEEMATTDMDVAYPNFVTLYYIVERLGGADRRSCACAGRSTHAIDREALLGTLLPKDEKLAVALFPPQTAGYPERPAALSL